jgi:hypothetical protein
VKPRPANIGQKLCRPTGLVLFDLRYFASGYSSKYLSNLMNGRCYQMLRSGGVPAWLQLLGAAG